MGQPAQPPGQQNQPNTSQPGLSDVAGDMTEPLNAANAAAAAFIGFQERITEITEALDSRESELDEREQNFKSRVQTLETEVDSLEQGITTLQTNVENLSDQLSGADSEDVQRSWDSPEPI